MEAHHESLIVDAKHGHSFSLSREKLIFISGAHTGFLVGRY